MATSKTWNGSSYSIPASGERNWPSLSSFLIALADGAQTTGLQKVGMRVATSSPVTVSASSDCIVVVALSSPGPVTVNLPAGTTGQWFAIIDGTGDAATNNITVTPASGLINGASTYVIGKNRAGIVIAYNGTSWNLVAEFTSESSTTGAITIKDANFTVQDDADPTKQFKFQASGITAGQTRTFTVPDASTTMVGTDTAQTITNKTIDADQNTITNIDNADIKAAAAIGHSKLADITAGSVLMGNGSNVPTATALSGDVTVNSSGVTAIGAGKVTNAMLATATSANTAGAVVARDGSGNFSAGTITASLSGNATNVTGTVAIANGGTGQTTANAAINALLPSQATHTGKALTTNGTDTQWTTVDTAALSQYHVKVGDSGGTAAPVNTNLVGEILATSTGGFTIKSTIPGKTFNSPTIIDGTTDAVQLTIQGNSTQTTNIFDVQNSSATSLLYIEPDGDVVVSFGNLFLGTVRAIGFSSSSTADDGSATFTLPNSAFSNWIELSFGTGNTSGTGGDTENFFGFARGGGWVQAIHTGANVQTFTSDVGLGGVTDGRIGICFVDGSTIKVYNRRGAVRSFTAHVRFR